MLLSGSFPPLREVVAELNPPEIGKFAMIHPQILHPKTKALPDHSTEGGAVDDFEREIGGRYATHT